MLLFDTNEYHFYFRIALSPFVNLEMQHDRRSARIWMKKVNYSYVIVGGQKGFAREQQN
jgi:hypothetical protein